MAIFRPTTFSIGSSTVTYGFQVTTTGSTTAFLSDAGVWVNASDRRLKENVQPIAYGLGTIMKLKPVSYEMKQGHEKQIGFIAQDVEAVIPELVGSIKTAEFDDQRTLSYDQMAAVTVKAIQELKAENDILKQKIAALEDGAGGGGGHARLYDEGTDTVTLRFKGGDMLMLVVGGGLGLVGGAALRRAPRGRGASAAQRRRRLAA